MRLIICSNSAPDMYFTLDNGEREHRFASPGGLVPMMTALLSELGGHWIFATSTPPEAAHPAFRHKGVSLHPVWISGEISRAYREDYCVRTLLWLFHYLHETSLRSEPVPGSRPAWDAYKKVNHLFADALAAEHQNTSDEIVLVNDIHLLLVPGIFTDRCPERESRLVYFHHVPWCEPEYFGILPEAQRNEILRSILRADVAGFHSRRWAQAFLACCLRYIPEAAIDPVGIRSGGHLTRLAVSPGTVDQGMLDRVRNEPETVAWRQELRRLADGRRMIVRVDRMDLWKNHLRGFAAYERLLDSNRQRAPDLWFCVLASPTRLQTERHVGYRVMCEQMVDRINQRFGNGRETVSLLYPESAQAARYEAVAALSLASVTLVNPTWDGLNLVAKESFLLAERSQVILSVNAGAHDQLTATSLPVNPFDEEATASVLDHAIGTDEIVAAAMTARARDLLAEENAINWLNALLKPAGLLGADC